MTDELREKAQALFKAALEKDEGETDRLLSTLTEDEAEEVQEELDLTSHLLDVFLGYVEPCPNYQESRNGVESDRYGY